MKFTGTKLKKYEIAFNLLRVQFMLCLVFSLGRSPLSQALAQPIQSPDQIQLYSENFTSFDYRDAATDANWDIQSHQLGLPRKDGVSQSYPVVKIDHSGDTLVVWADARNGGNDIYARKFDRYGNPIWPNDIKVNAAGGAAIDYGGPAVAVDSNDNIIVTWLDSRNGKWEPYAQKLDTNGLRLWSNDIAISTEDQTPLSYPGYATPAIAYDAGTFFAAWQGYRNDVWNIYVQRIDGNGSRLWSSDTQVNTIIAGMNRYNPSIAVNNGLIVVAWETLGSAVNTYDIFAQRLDLSGNRIWSGDVRANDIAGYAWPADPIVSITSGGMIYVAWGDNRSGETDLFVQRLSASGGRLWSGDRKANGATAVATMGGDHSFGIANAAADGIFLTWAEYTVQTNSDLYAQRLTSSGDVVWANAQPVNQLNTPGEQWYPIAASGPTGDFAVVWSDNRTGDLDIYMQRLQEDGVRQWTADVRCNQASGSSNQRVPSVVTTSDFAFMAWRDQRAGGDIYAQKIDWVGNKYWGNDLRVNLTPVGLNFRDGLPAIAITNLKEVVIIWTATRNGLTDIYAQKLDSNGNRIWASDTRVNAYVGSAWPGHPIVQVDKLGKIVVVWGDEREGYYQGYAQRLDENGNRLWANDVRISASTINSKYPQGMKLDPDGNLIAVWWEYRPDPWPSQANIFAQKISTNGTYQWSSDVQVNRSSDSNLYPDLAVDGNGNALVVWSNYQQSNGWDILSQRLAPNGDRLWTSDLIVNKNVSGNQIESHISMDSYRNSTVIFKSNNQLVAQRITSSGAPMWSNDQIVTSGSVGLANTAVHTRSDGTSMIVWEEQRNHNSDIFGQTLTSSGSRMWTNDLLVVLPDSFYFSSAVAQSQTVAAPTTPVKSALLTSAMTLNGGSVAYSLSADGGIHWENVTPGVAHTFTYPGNDLRWQAKISGDPVWNRTPVVNNLRIEYGDLNLNKDSYEPDSTCADARPVAVNGAAQSHTFDQASDADWIRFDAVAGTSYIIETINTGSLANTEAVASPNCTTPLSGTSRSFGNGYSISFTATTSTQHYVRVSQKNPAVFGPDTAYTVSVRAAQRPTAVALIVAGHDGANSEESNILYAANRAYRVFLNAGLGKANVRYLTPTSSQDADGDGINDSGGLSTPANLRDSIQSWARERGVGLGVPLIIYMVDHGLTDYFKVAGDALSQQVSAADLNLWLSNLEATTGIDNITVIIDACYSGSFIDVSPNGPRSISGHGRVIISSASSGGLAYGPADGRGLYFSNAFFGALESQQSVWASFMAGREAVAAQGQGQQPWLDDNGDKLMDSQDGSLSRNGALRRVALGGQAPRLEWVSANKTTGLLRVKVTDDSAWVEPRVEIFAPSFQAPPADGQGTTRLLDVPVVVLSDADGDRIYERVYALPEVGIYRLVVQAEDSEGDLAMPVSVTVDTRKKTFLPLTRR